jgi:hypothetical protein
MFRRGLFSTIGEIAGIAFLVLLALAFFVGILYYLLPHRTITYAVFSFIGATLLYQEERTKTSILGGLIVGLIAGILIREIFFFLLS